MKAMLFDGSFFKEFCKQLIIHSLIRSQSPVGNIQDLKTGHSCNYPDADCHSNRIHSSLISKIVSTKIYSMKGYRFQDVRNNDWLSSRVDESCNLGSRHFKITSCTSSVYKLCFQSNSRAYIFEKLGNIELLEFGTCSVKLKGRRFLSQGESTLENYILHKCSIRPIVAQFFKTIAAKLKDQFCDKNYLKMGLV